LGNFVTVLAGPVQYQEGMSAMPSSQTRLAGLRGAVSRSAISADTLRWGLAVLGAVGAALLIVSEFTTVTHVKVITVVLPGTAVSGFDQNSGAMLILGVAALPMLLGAALGASRPAMAAAALIGLIALLIALIGDLPDVTRVGTILRERYEDAKAEPQTGFYLETLGAVLLLIAGGALLLVSGTGKSGAARRTRGEAAAKSSQTTPAP
jgi:hypothetical protein